MTVLVTGLTTEHKNETNAHPISSISGLQAALDSKFSTGGGTLTGALRGTTIEMSGAIRSVGADLVGIRMFGASGYGYLQAGHATDDANQKLAISGHNAKYLTEIYARVRGGANPYMLDELGNRSNFYSERNKPTAADVGVNNLGLGGSAINIRAVGITDLNKITVSGDYYTSDPSDLNKPASLAGPVMHVQSSAGFQMYVRDNDFKIRGFTGVVFQGWQTLYHTGNRPTAVDISAINPTTKREDSLSSVINSLASRIAALESKLGL